MRRFLPQMGRWRLRRPLARRLSLALACVGALTSLAAGCTQAPSTSAGRFNGESKAVAQEVDDWISAASKRDDKHICTQDLSSALVGALNRAKGGCQEAIRRQLDSADNFDLTVQSVAVSRDQATAQVKSTNNGHNRIDTLVLVKEGGRWHMAGLGRLYGAPPSTAPKTPAKSPTGRGGPTGASGPTGAHGPTGASGQQGAKPRTAR